MFQFAALTLDLAISAGELPISLERFQLEPALRPPQSLVRLGGYRYSATFYACRVGAPVATWQALEERLTHSAQTLSQPGEMLWGVSALVAHGAGPVIGSIEPGKLADLVLSKPAFFGVKPEMVVKGGLIAWSVMGDANASIPTPQPVLYRPMFGSFGKATAATSVTFLSQATVEAGIPEQLGLAKGIVPVEKCRTVGKADMIHNNATPLLEVDPETYEVRADGELLTCEPASELPMAQRYFLF